MASLPVVTVDEASFADAQQKFVENPALCLAKIAQFFELEPEKIFDIFARCYRTYEGNPANPRIAQELIEFNKTGRVPAYVVVTYLRVLKSSDASVQPE